MALATEFVQWEGGLPPVWPSCWRTRTLSGHVRSMSYAKEIKQARRAQSSLNPQCGIWNVRARCWSKFKDTDLLLSFYLFYFVTYKTDRRRDEFNVSHWNDFLESLFIQNDCQLSISVISHMTPLTTTLVLKG